MADTGIREKVVGFAKEGARLTLETADRWIAPESGSEFQVERALLEDNGVRDIKEKFPAVPGRKTVNGTISNLPVEMNDDFAMLVDSVMGKNAGAGAIETDAYVHTFTPATSIIPDTMSFHIDRGATLGVKGYNGCMVKKLNLTQAQDERLMCNAEIIGINEASGNVGSPSFSDPNPFTFDDMSTITVGGASNKANIVGFTIDIDNQAKPKTVLDGNDYASDIICTDGLIVSGSFDIIFVADTERDKFVAGTSSDLVITYVGDVMATDNYKLIIDVHKIQYTAFPFGDIDGLFGASVAFTGVYSTGDSGILTVTIWNTQSAAY